MANSVPKQLFEHCKHGKTQLLVDSLAEVDSCEIFDDRGYSLFDTALKNGHWNTATTLVEKSYINATESNSIISACQFRNDVIQGISTALSLFPDINFQNQLGRNALMTSCLLGHIKKVQELINNNAQCDITDDYGNNALIEAVRSKNTKLVELILTLNVNVNHYNKDGDTALLIAIKQKNPFEGIITALLKANGDPELVDKNKKSTWLIAKQKHPKLARFIEKHLNSINQIELPFFSNNYNPEPKEKPNQVEKTTPIPSQEPIISPETESKTKVENTRIEPTLTPVKVKTNAKEQKTVKIEPVKIKKKTQPSNLQEWFHAAKNGNLGGLNRLIMEGIDIDCIDNKGCSALIRACGHSRRAVVSFLLQQKADIELRSKNGSTALSSSVIGNCRRVAGLLLEKGANPNGLGPSNYSYATIAAAQWNDAMLSILYRNKSDIFIENKQGQSLLHIIAMGAEYNHNINIAKSSVQFLIDHGLNLNQQDSNGNTPLMILCGAHTGKFKVNDRDIASIAHYLLKLGAAAAITNKAGESAIDATRLHKLQQTKGVLMNALSWND